MMVAFVASLHSTDRAASLATGPRAHHWPSRAPHTPRAPMRHDSHRSPTACPIRRAMSFSGLGGTALLIREVTADTRARRGQRCMRPEGAGGGSGAPRPSAPGGGGCRAPLGWTLARRAPPGVYLTAQMPSAVRLLPGSRAVEDGGRGEACTPRIGDRRPRAPCATVAMPRLWPHSRADGVVAASACAEPDLPRSPSWILDIWHGERHGQASRASSLPRRRAEWREASPVESSGAATSAPPIATASGPPRELVADVRGLQSSVAGAAAPASGDGRRRWRRQSVCSARRAERFSTGATDGGTTPATTPPPWLAASPRC